MTSQKKEIATVLCGYISPVPFCSSYIVLSSFSVLHANLLLQSEAKSKVYWTLLLGSLSHFQCEFFLCRVRAHGIQQPNIAKQGCCSSMSLHPTSSKAEQVVLISTVKCINTCPATQVSMSKRKADRVHTDKNISGLFTSLADQDESLLVGNVIRLVTDPWMSICVSRQTHAQAAGSQLTSRPKSL